MGEQGPQAGRVDHDDEVEEGVEEEDDHDDDNLDEGGDSLVVTIFMINVYDL